MEVKVFKTGFNSLQTGRSFRTVDIRRQMLRKIWFQFPSNGKVFPNKSELKAEIKRRGIVSIPFKREGLSEHLSNLVFLANWESKFQFPSNGKVFPNMIYPGTWSCSSCFNSLQTGRSFRTKCMLLLTTRVWFSFNSLQTGRSFRTNRKN